MRKIAATYVFPISSAPLKNGILVCDNDGVVRDVIATQSGFKETAGVEYYSGILVPGFVFEVTELQHIDNYFYRKMWANGIAYLADCHHKKGLEIRAADCQSSVLNTPIRDEGISSDLCFSQNQLLENSVAGLLLQLEKSKSLSLEQLFKLVCLAQAEKFEVKSMYGSFESGKQAGVNLLSGVDFVKMKLTESLKIKRLA